MPESGASVHPGELHPAQPRPGPPGPRGPGSGQPEPILRSSQEAEQPAAAVRDRDRLRRVPEEQEVHR